MYSVRGDYAYFVSSIMGADIPRNFGFVHSRNLAQSQYPCTGNHREGISSVRELFSCDGSRSYLVSTGVVVMVMGIGTARGSNERKTVGICGFLLRVRGAPLCNHPHDISCMSAQACTNGNSIGGGLH
jgi:hypothetical protein